MSDFLSTTPIEISTENISTILEIARKGLCQKYPTGYGKEIDSFCAWFGKSLGELIKQRNDHPPMAIVPRELNAYAVPNMFKQLAFDRRPVSTGSFHTNILANSVQIVRVGRSSETKSTRETSQQPIQLSSENMPAILGVVREGVLARYPDTSEQRMSNYLAFFKKGLEDIIGQRSEEAPMSIVPRELAAYAAPNMFKQLAFDQRPVSSESFRNNVLANSRPVARGVTTSVAGGAKSTNAFPANEKRYLRKIVSGPSF